MLTVETNMPISAQDASFDQEEYDTFIEAVRSAMDRAGADEAEIVSACPFGPGNAPRRVMHLRIAAVLVALIPISACETVAPKSYHQPEIVTGTPENVAIKAGMRTDPVPLAVEHCAKYGKGAALRKSEMFEYGSSPATFYFDCVKSDQADK